MGGGEELLARGATGLLAVGAFAGAGLLAGAVNRSGALAGWLLGLLMWIGLGWRGFVLLTAFVVLGTAATRLGAQRKSALGVAQPESGRRGARHALANASIPAAAALVAAAASDPGWVETAAVAAAGALAAVTSDTLSSEIGQAWGGQPVLVLGGQRVAPGTDGAISWVGSLAGVVGAAAIALLARGLGSIPPAALVAVTLGGVVGNGADSLLGASLERRGRIGNGTVNLLASCAGALVAAVLHGV